MRMSERRSFLQTAGALALSYSLPLKGQTRFSSYPFALGVASGYPSPDGVVLWTRLMGGLGPAAIPVRWEIAADEAMRKVVASGTAQALPEWAHSVHVEVRGLEPDRWYWYRFIAGDPATQPGRPRPAPAPAAH